MSPSDLAYFSREHNGEHSVKHGAAQKRIETREQRKPCAANSAAPVDSHFSSEAKAALDPKCPPSEAGLRLACLLRDRVRANNAGAKITETKFESWAREADLMIGRDGRTESQIGELVEWSQHDPFWRTNILSMGKLREKFDQLTLKKNSSGKGAAIGTSRVDNLREVGTALGLTRRVN
jgi:hypothetical protein